MPRISGICEKKSFVISFHCFMASSTKVTRAVLSSFHVSGRQQPVEFFIYELTVVRPLSFLISPLSLSSSTTCGVNALLASGGYNGKLCSSDRLGDKLCALVVLLARILLSVCERRVGSGASTTARKALVWG